MEENLEQKSENYSDISNNTSNSNSEQIKETKSEKVLNINEKNLNSQNNSDSKVEKKDGNDTPPKTIPEAKKELPVEKKPFQEFINIHLIPSIKEEINQRGFEIKNINLKNTNRPIAGDKCWVVNCEIKDTCTFWLSFEKEDISSLKSISLSKPNQKPSIIESFLIDEKRITLKLIISRVLQRLNGQKLIGVN
ncbi:DUF2996 domain-containing protein [Prochlorococcus marinus str. MU1404]|uniref:DUF2996 domain-containing protein n=1 Tax=Prochlorococcus marinus TaxID=1219 RepID=UPI001ADB6284|nr:DUF2996 domain-containing protein [Prochlorococcus marinus]MBO8230179.1 DUF2996 domain-containing protein [Prochlorococcus marinus XMU1404]MBW3073049.1 DUF2996 domain-containing protein [Prochlorococcus marinus str. MU1404]MCR8545483.1 DUF2996 domain-containing protein [Prochlorococcus marinus CUG1432]